MAINGTQLEFETFGSLVPPSNGGDELEQYNLFGFFSAYNESQPLNFSI